MRKSGASRSCAIKIKVWHINNIASVGPALVAGLRRAGVDAHFFDAPKPFAAAPLVLKLFGFMDRLRFARRLLRSARTEGVQVLHIHYSSSAVWFLFGGIPIVVHSHGSDVRLTWWNFFRHAINWVVFRNAAAIYYSTPDMEVLMRRYTTRARFSPNAINLHELSPGSGPRDPHLIFLNCALNHIKGADIAISAIAELKREFPHLRFLAVQAGVYVAEARAAGIELCPRLSREKLVELVGRAGLVLGQFRVGSIGMSELEDLAVGRTVACHFIYNHLYSTPPPFVAAHTKEEIIEVVRAYVKNPGVYNELESQARAWVERFHNADAVAASLVEEYRRILSLKPRVLVLADGASIHTQRWIEGLDQSGKWDLFLLSMNPAPVRGEIRSIPSVKDVVQIAPSRISEAGNNYHYLFHLPAIWRKIREIRPSVISAVYLPSYGLVGALLKGSAKLVQFVVGDDIMIFPAQGWLHRVVTRFALSRSSFVVSASATMADRIVNGFHYDPAKILTQQYGVTDWVIEYPVKPKDYDFVSNRAWVSNSNVEYFLDILRDLPSCRTALIGEAVVGSEELARRVEGAVATVRGCERLGSLPYKENIDCVARSRFLVSLTTSDGASLSVMEGMALGAIPVVSDTAPNREWIRDGVNGFLVPLDDRAGAVKRFRAALALDESERGLIIERNRNIIEERGSLKHNMNRVGRVMAELGGV